MGVSEGSSAEKAGVKEGDVIVAVDGIALKELFDLTYELRPEEGRAEGNPGRAAGRCADRIAGFLRSGRTRRGRQTLKNAAEIRTVRHLTGMRVFWTLAPGWGCSRRGLAVPGSGRRRPRTDFLFSCALLLTVLGLAVISLPWRLRSTLSAEGATIGWMLGKRRIPWSEVRRVVIGPLGSGKERDPTSAVLLLRSGEEVLFAVLGRIPPEAHPPLRPSWRPRRRRAFPWTTCSRRPRNVPSGRRGGGGPHPGQR